METETELTNTILGRQVFPSSNIKEHFFGKTRNFSAEEMLKCLIITNNVFSLHPVMCFPHK